MFEFAWTDAPARAQSSQVSSSSSSSYTCFSFLQASAAVTHLSAFLRHSKQLHMCLRAFLGFDLCQVGELTSGGANLKSALLTSHSIFHLAIFLQHSQVQKKSFNNYIFLHFWGMYLLFFYRRIYIRPERRCHK